MKTIVIGAGMAGLIFSKAHLSRANNSDASLVILEKSKGVGGRLATRRVGNDRLDHGAQFYEPSASLLEHHLRWKHLGMVSAWPPDQLTATFSAKGGMTQIAKELASSLPIHIEKKVNLIERLGGDIVAHCENGDRYEGQRLVITSPLPQALELLNTSNIDFISELKDITYTKAIVCLIYGDHLELNNSTLDYYSPENSTILTVTNQKTKGLSNATALTVTFSPRWSNAHFEMADTNLTPLLVDQLRAFVPNIQGPDLQKKRWRFACPMRTFKEPFYQAAPSIFLIGDAFGGPHVGGAAASAMALNEAISSR